MTTQFLSATKDVQPTDIIIAFMGPTGSGKSFFIDLLTGQSGRRSRNSLASATSDVEAIRMPLPGDSEGRYLVLVDTPGFDDTTRSDMQILYMIGDWLKTTYTDGVKISGLIYLHRITDNRMAGSPYKNLRMFGQLCGNIAMGQVVLVSTMWGKVQPEIGCVREKQLKEIFWKDLIEQGADVDRLQDATLGAAWDVVSKLIRRRRNTAEAVLLQEEMVDNGTELKETQAGKTLYNSLQRQLAEQKETLTTLLAQLKESDDPTVKRELERERDRIQREFDRTFEEVEKLRVSLFRRLFSFLFTKKTKSKAVNVSSGP